MTEPRPCRFCGAKIVFAKGAGDVEIALTKIGTVWTIDAGDGAVKIDLPEQDKYALHRDVCPKIEQAKKAVEKKGQPREQSSRNARR